ncbi:MAG TPA: hypothetical protein VFE82_06620 [Ramlibacter sp.]|jgi:tetratricopeptide (TPR) repeat protein|uniref:tetratricopeptide repeat protein n=1 Tax=Ramlibacter sp. TaxID=1917967 RepID=UPI002D25A884|nr:hypothetical protein [Ramlibacter sp.]HZY18139.1 hypothetical protein [Ramlibacter sp.]
MLRTIAGLLAGTARRERGAAAPYASLRTEGAFITAWDAQGREIYIDRRTWLLDVLLPNLRRHWDDADALADLVVGGVDDGFATNLLEASRRVLELDRHRKPERGYLLRGIVLRENRRLSQAQSVLEEGIRLVGRRAALLVNLAKVHAERDDGAKAEALLWEGLQGDPNLEAGLAWWVEGARRRSGEEGARQALRQAAGLPRSWLAPLWLARGHLQAQELDEAVALYRRVLGSAHQQPLAVATIAQDLARHRQAGALVELLGPVYDPLRHEAQAGVQLLDALLQLQRRKEGQALLVRLERVAPAALQPRLQALAEAFAVPGGGVPAA